MSIDLATAHKTSIKVQYGDLADVVDWCKRNCKNEWKFMEDMNDQWNGYVFFFESYRDFVAFTLWKK